LRIGICGKRSKSGNLLKVRCNPQCGGNGVYFYKKNKDLHALTESHIDWQEQIKGKFRETSNAYSQVFHRAGLALEDLHLPENETGAEALCACSAPDLKCLE
jgi:hypothetical protein